LNKILVAVLEAFHGTMVALEADKEQRDEKHD
jgi:hypothetical protein